MHSKSILLNPSSQLNFIHPTWQGTQIKSVEQKSKNGEEVIVLFKRFLICIEDKRFYKHRGLDFRGILRAILKNLKARKIVQGGSTLTQQLARRLLKDNCKSIRRKLRESRLALQLEKNHNKAEILDLYLEKIYWGGNVFGIHDAALTYFKKTVSELSLSEIIQLIALLRGPNLYLKNQLLLTQRCELIQRTLKKSGQFSELDHHNLYFNPIDTNAPNHKTI